MKKIFVAGASGFIGKSLVKYLKEKKYKVVSASSKKKANNLQIDLHYDYIRIFHLNY